MRCDGESDRQRISIRLAVKKMNSKYSDMKIGHQIGIDNKGFSCFYGEKPLLLTWIIQG
jgi:hypothetical protein